MHKFLDFKPRLGSLANTIDICYNNSAVGMTGFDGEG
jgi:hypothetical protein